MAIEKHKNLTAIEFFYGAGAMFHGLGQSVIQVLVGIDNEMEYQRTYGKSLHSLARHIGNTLPPELARRVGEHIKQIQQNG
jgi:site-specific DNA-cytosine methylase